MKQKYALLLFFMAAFNLNAQFQEVKTSKVLFKKIEYKPSDMDRRGVSNPTACKTDTSYFVQYCKGLRFVTIRSGSSLGQFYGAPQDLTISGFRLYAFANAVNPARPVFIKLRCHLYKAGSDSLPTGSPLASDTVTVDTILRTGSFSINVVQFDAKFKNPVTLNYSYILVVDCDSTTVSAALMTSDWTQGDGRKRNLGCGSVSGKWYRNLQLNIGGVTFDADAQLLPFVKYNFGADFSITNNCYSNLDTVRFQNQQKFNVSGHPYYNYYNFANFPQFSHRWSYDGSFGSNYSVEGKYKPTTKKNFKVQLISMVYQYRSGTCYDTAVKTVYFKPSSPALKRAANLCRGDTTTIDVSSDAGVTIKWYRKLGDTAFYTGSSYPIINAQKNDSFWVRAENGPCNSGYVKIYLNVNDYPDKPTVKDAYVCQGAAANLQASTNIGLINWYTASTGGRSLLTGTVYQTAPLFNDTVLFAEANNNGCLNKGGRIKVTAFVSNNYAPQKPTVVADTFTCFSAGKSFTLGASGNDTIRWYSQPTGGTPIAFGKNYTFVPSGRGTYDYFVEVWNGTCASSRESTTLHVYQPPAVSGKTNPTVCAGDSVLFNISIPWGSLNWYGKTDLLNPIYVGTKPVFQNLQSNTTYYLKSAEEQCIASNFDSVKVTVNVPPVPSLVKSDPVCSKGAGLFQVNVTGGNVWWYYEDTSSTSFFKGSQITTGPLLSPMTYYYATEKNGCYSVRKPLTIAIKPRPTAGFTWQLRWQRTLVCTPITTAGLTFEWNWGDGSKTNGLPGTHQYANEGNYTVKLVVTGNSNGCKDTADIPVLISHVGTSKLAKTNVNAYPVPVKAGSDWFVSVPSGKTYNYMIFSVSGNVCSGGQTADGRIRIPAGVTAGMYFVKLYNGGESLSAKMLVTEP
ncbi:MAG: T9SS type A sorting domain-containing protein [Bacteroidetes bacterium]|nr:T9SS type A sorting domain-containing protein [Bacteroidota bacterium]